MKLPSKGWGPWRKEFYSFRSFHAEPEDFTFGVWHNVWLSRLDGIVHDHCYRLWHWWHNRSNSKSRREIERFFPKLRG